jgi:hypothetical protein
MIKNGSFRQIVRNELQKIGNDINCPEQAPTYCLFENQIVKNSPTVFRKIKTESKFDLSKTDLQALAIGLTEQFGTKIDVKFKPFGYCRALHIYFKIA